MSDLLQKIKLGTNNVKLIKWPNSDTQVALKILSQTELQEAIFATERLFKKENVEVNLITSDEYENEKATQILYRSLRDPANIVSYICPNITDFRSSLTKEEKLFLINEYLTFEKDSSPRSDSMSGEEFDKFISDLKKNASLINQNSLSSSMLRKCIITLVSQLETLQNPNVGSLQPLRKQSTQPKKDQTKSQ